MAKLYLGLDSSTQSMTATVLAAEGADDARMVLEKSVNFAQAFPAYGTRNGALPGPDGEAQSPPQMWVEALEAVLAEVARAGVAMGDIRAIGVSGQQHGSVYLNATAEKTLAGLDPARGLAEQVAGIYSRKLSPIWMDASTSRQCAEIATALGGDDAVCALTGSRVFERFTGPQIRKFFQIDPQGYAATRHICLVSSFIPSLLAGKIVPIDPGDGAGMNLMDIGGKRWSQKALDATAPDLAAKLLPIAPSDAVVAAIAPYFVRRFGFRPDCALVPGTGDNPSSLVGLGLVSPGTVGISLGTSDTLFAAMSQARTDPSGQSHVFGSPAGGYMALSCYKNGSLAREAVRDRHRLDWPAFTALLERGEPGNRGRLMLPYFDTEIIPKVLKPGVVRAGFGEGDAEAEVRAVVEAQAMSMSLHAEWMPERPARIYATGGASANRAVLQVFADVFGAPVHRQETTAAAALGAALRAWHGSLAAGGHAPAWEEVVRPFVTGPGPAIQPRPEAQARYAEAKGAYRKLEGEHLRTLQGGR